jgi:hypothetical protein
MKAAPALPAAALFLVTALAGSLAPPASVDLRDLDDAWLHTTYEQYRDVAGFIDVAYTTQPFLHVALLFRDAVPDRLPVVHPTLATRAYVVDAEPLTHDPLVPVMDLLAQDVPTGIRPGQWMQLPHPCTFSFVVRDSANDLHILTAGHCVDFVGQAVTIRGLGTIGHVRAFVNGGVGADYAVVKILSSQTVNVNPRTIGWGGPTTVATGTVPLSTGVKHYGWGALTWQTHETRCRVGAGPLLWGATTVGWSSVTIWGDSGSELLLADGRAAGIVTHLSTAPWQGTVLGTRYTHAVAQMGTTLGTTFTLESGGPILTTCDGNT